MSDVHEQLEYAEHAKHAAHASKQIALLIAVLALFLALSETLGKSANTEAIGLNIKVNDTWNFLQAQTIRAALRAVMGSHIDRVSVSSTKSCMGHLIAAAGAVEAALCTLAIHDGVAPVSANLVEPESPEALAAALEAPGQAAPAGFFTLGVPAERYHLPHPRLGLPVLLLIRRVVLRAFELLRNRAVSSRIGARQTGRRHFGRSQFPRDLLPLLGVIARS